MTREIKNNIPCIVYSRCSYILQPLKNIGLITHVQFIPGLFDQSERDGFYVSFVYPVKRGILKNKLKICNLTAILSDKHTIGELRRKFGEERDIDIVSCKNSSEVDRYVQDITSRNNGHRDYDTGLVRSIKDFVKARHRSIIEIIEEDDPASNLPIAS